MVTEGKRGRLDASATPFAGAQGRATRRLPLRTGHDQFALENALQSPQLGGDRLQPVRWSAQDDHLQAQVVGQMGVQRRNHQVMVLVLHGHQAFAELGAMMVVDQGQRARRIARLAGPRLTRERIAQQLPDRLAAGGKLPLLAVAIEGVEQVVFQRDGEAGDFGHGGGRG